MPVMDGPTTRTRLTERYGDDAPKVVAVTASAFEHERQQFMDMGFDHFLSKPLLAAQVYSCLASLLGVEFSFTDEARDDAGPPVAAEDDVRLPGRLKKELIDAAATHSITELRRQLGGLGTLGEAQQRLGTRLLELARSYDFDGIQAALGEVEEE
jgi:CheY-like chemotaxis protein